MIDVCMYVFKHEKCNFQHELINVFDFLKAMEMVLSSLLFYAPTSLPPLFDLLFRMNCEVIYYTYIMKFTLTRCIHSRSCYIFKYCEENNFFLHNIWKIFIAQTLPLRKVDRVTRIQYIYVYVVYIKLYTHLYV